MVAWLVGPVIGSFFTYLSEIAGPIVRVTTVVASRTIEAIPIIVALFWLHYPVQHALEIVVNPIYSTALVVSIYNAFAFYRLLNGGIANVPREMVETADALGLSQSLILRRISAPIAVRAKAGDMVSAQIAVLQASIFGAFISAEEVFRAALRYNASVYSPVEVYTGVAVLFIVICLPLNFLADTMKSRGQEQRD